MELQKYKLADLYDISSGISISKEKLNHGYRSVSFKMVFNNYFLPEEIKDLVNVDEKQLKSCSVLKDDVLITRTSETINELAMSSVSLHDYKNTTFSGFTKRLRPKKKGIVYSKYIGFYLRSPYFRKQINNHTTMTLRASFNSDIFSLLHVYLPKYEDQIKIGDFLYSLLQKIEINKQINDNLYY